MPFEHVEFRDGIGLKLGNGLFLWIRGGEGYKQGEMELGVQHRVKWNLECCLQESWESLGTKLALMYRDEGLLHMML